MPSATLMSACPPIAIRTVSSGCASKRSGGSIGTASSCCIGRFHLLFILARHANQVGCASLLSNGQMETTLTSTDTVLPHGSLRCYTEQSCSDKRCVFRCFCGLAFWVSILPPQIG